MALFEMVNTEIAMAVPLGTTIDAAFGEVALALLKKKDTKSLDRLMVLHEETRKIMKELEGLGKPRKGKS